MEYRTLQLADKDAVDQVLAPLGRNDSALGFANLYSLTEKYGTEVRLEGRALHVRQRRRLPGAVAYYPPLGGEDVVADIARLLEEAVLRVYPLVAGSGVPMPQIKLRKMKSQWGNCHYRQGYITLNTALARCPEFLRDYVALHELVHFLHHDHGPGFYAAMDARMPDWRKRRQDLKRYAQALVL